MHPSQNYNPNDKTPYSRPRHYIHPFPPTPNTKPPNPMICCATFRIHTCTPNQTICFPCFLRTSKRPDLHIPFQSLFSSLPPPASSIPQAPPTTASQIHSACRDSIPPNESPASQFSPHPASLPSACIPPPDPHSNIHSQNPPNIPCSSFSSSPIH